MQRGAVGTGDHGNDAWITWQRALALARQESVFLQLRACALEGFAPQAVPLRLEPADRELHVAARRVHGELAERGHLHTVVRCGGDRATILRPDDATQLGIAVAETEIPVAIPVRLEIDDLAAHPERHERAFENVLRGFRNGRDAYRGRWRRTGKRSAEILIDPRDRRVGRRFHARLGGGRRTEEIQVAARATVVASRGS